MEAPELLCFERTCGYCGARLEISAVALPGDPRTHLFACPQCGKPDEFSSTGNPHVRVLKARADGKNDRYQQTMF